MMSVPFGMTDAPPTACCNGRLQVVTPSSSIISIHRDKPDGGLAKTPILERHKTGAGAGVEALTVASIRQFLPVRRRSTRAFWAETIRAAARTVSRTSQ